MTFPPLSFLDLYLLFIFLITKQKVESDFCFSASALFFFFYFLSFHSACIKQEICLHFASWLPDVVIPAGCFKPNWEPMCSFCWMWSLFQPLWLELVASPHSSSHAEFLAFPLHIRPASLSGLCVGCSLCPNHLAFSPRGSLRLPWPPCWRCHLPPQQMRRSLPSWVFFAFATISLLSHPCAALFLFIRIWVPWRQAFISVLLAVLFLVPRTEPGT